MGAQLPELGHKDLHLSSVGCSGRMQARGSGIVKSGIVEVDVCTREQRARQPLRVTLRPQVGLPGGVMLCQGCQVPSGCLHGGHTSQRPALSRGA